MPWVSFIAGIGGSLHCVGMCGGLATATCQNKEDIFKYQFGRLTGYITLGIFAGLLGHIFTVQSSNPKLTLIPGLLLGALFLFWGIENLRGKKAEIPTPKIFSKIYSKLWKNFILKNKGFSKSYLTGLLSIFLPCGLLYGIVIGVAAFDHSFKAIFAMFFFWLGTLPSMMFAPTVIHKFLSPLKSKLPKTYALSLIFIGLVTISMRVVKFNEVNAAGSPAANKHQCH
jgi:sulfite exporter TauE/SafE